MASTRRTTSTCPTWGWRSSVRCGKPAKGLCPKQIAWMVMPMRPKAAGGVTRRVIVYGSVRGEPSFTNSKDAWKGNTGEQHLEGLRLTALGSCRRGLKR
eukprot:6153367-Pyramimonas_sp.AAC.1